MLSQRTVLRRTSRFLILPVIGLVLVAGIAALRGPAGAADAAITPSATASSVDSDVGKPISVPSASSGELALYGIGTAPAITQKQAMQAVADIGVPWGLGGSWDGKPVVVTAAYGLATFGHAGADGSPWIGDRNFTLPSGQVLDHVAGRPMWIIDYGGTIAYGGGCPTCADATFNHTVYAVDAASRSVLKIWFYKGG